MTGKRPMSRAVPGPGANALAAPLGALTRRRPLLTLKPKVARLDDGGEVGSRDIGVAAVDKDFSIDNSGAGGFLGSPEMGGTRSDPNNPNVASGLTAAQDEIATPTIGGRIANALVGPQTLDFDPVTGTFSTTRDYAGALGRTAISQVFGPLGPVVGLGMRLGSKYGEGQPEDYDAARGYGSASRNPGGERGAGNADGGRVRMANGGIPPAVAAIIARAMQQRAGGSAPHGAAAPPAPGMPGAGAPPAPGAAGPQAAPAPFRFIPDSKELIRRWGGGAPAPQALAHAALAHGGAPGAASGSGLFRGPGGGRSDAIPADLEPDGYVLPADHVAAKGDGSNEAGAARIAAEIGNPDAARPVTTVRGGRVPARVSNGEMYLGPEDTARAGGPNALAADIHRTRKAAARKLKSRKGPRR